jgi:hypothetical protein
MDELKLAYLAGIIDGEGSIMYVKGSLDKRRNKQYYRVVLRIANNDMDLIQWITDNFPNKWYLERKTWRGANQDDSFVLNLHYQRAVELITAVEPYLVSKNRQAKIARLAGYYHSLLRGKPGLKDPLEHIRIKLHAMMKQSNYRGKNSMAIRKKVGEFGGSLVPKVETIPSQADSTLLEGVETTGEGTVLLNNQLERPTRK